MLYMIIENFRDGDPLCGRGSTDAGLTVWPGESTSPRESDRQASRLVFDGSSLSGAFSISGGSRRPFLNSCTPFPRLPIISGQATGAKDQQDDHQHDEQFTEAHAEHANASIGARRVSRNSSWRVTPQRQERTLRPADSGHPHPRRRGRVGPHPRTRGRASSGCGPCCGRTYAAGGGCSVTTKCWSSGQRRRWKSSRL